LGFFLGFFGIFLGFLGFFGIFWDFIGVLMGFLMIPLGGGVMTEIFFLNLRVVLHFLRTIEFKI